MRYLLTFPLTCCICAAQSIVIGAMGGGRVTDDVLSFNTPESNVVSGVPVFRLQSRFYDVGPTVEIGLPHGLSVEFDALYHRQGFFNTFYHDLQYSTYSERDDSWEFPLLLKYKLRWLPANPFVDAGVVPRTMPGRITATFQSDYSGLTPPSPTPTILPASYRPGVGFVAGGGFQFNRGHLRLAPQVRYTRWFTTPVSGIDGGILGGTFWSNLPDIHIAPGR